MSNSKAITLEAATNNLAAYLKTYSNWIDDILQADGGNSYSVDFIILPILNRGIKLIDGYHTLRKRITYALFPLSGFSWIMPSVITPPF